MARAVDAAERRPRGLAGAQREVAPKPTPQLREGRKEITVQTLSTGQLALHARSPLAQSLRETFLCLIKCSATPTAVVALNTTCVTPSSRAAAVVLLGRVVPDHDRRAHGPEVVQVSAI